MGKSAEVEAKKLNTIAQGGVVPVRRMDDGRIEFCLVTSRSTGDWIFPKGHIDPGEDARLSAVRETQEEAGLVGNLDDVNPLGSYAYQKGGRIHEVTVYLFLIETVETNWEEMDQRLRVFADANTAAKLVPFKELRDLIHAAEARLSNK